MGIELISKKDNHWRKYALSLCGDRQLADDIVQDMYLKIHNKPTPLNDYYIYATIKSVFIDYTRKAKPIKLSHDIKQDQSIFEPDDKQNEIIEKFKKLDWYKQELIQETYDKSLRQIGDDLNGCYGFIHRTVTEARKEVLKDDFHLYKNSGLKYKKQKKAG